MRIAIYKDTLANRRGADFAVAALADGLRERGHDAVLFEKGELAARLREKWNAVVSTGTNELLDLAAEFQSDFPWPVVQQFHTNPRSQFKWKRFVRNWRIRRALRKVSAIQVLCESHVPQVSGYGPRVSVIGNWSRFADSSQAVDGKPSRESKPVIVYPAAFGGKKNHVLLVKAFASLADEFPDWTLELYGGGTPPADLPPNAKACGFCEGLGEAYGRCAFLAFPSLDEGFPLTIVDAAAFGKPAVMVRDWIGTASADGGIVAGPDIASYAEGLRRFMADAGLRTRMGEAARDFCAAAYSREKILDAWEKLFADL